MGQEQTVSDTPQGSGGPVPPPPPGGTGQPGVPAPPPGPPGGGSPPQPPGPPGGGSGGAPRGGGRAALLTFAVVFGVVVVGGGAVLAALLLSGGDDERVLLEPIGDPGPNPFTDPVAPEPDGYMSAFAERGAPRPEDEAVAASISDPAQRLEQRDGHLAIDGATPGLYGGTNQVGACDVEQLAAFLAEHPDRAEAWASVQGISAAEIDDYLAGLTPVNLGADTRVVNHGFVDGRATPREAVLQRGTAVLVDEHGVPQANCECGNPLAQASVRADEEYVGAAWDGFRDDAVVVVDPSPTPIDTFEITDITDGTRIDRPAGTGGEADRPTVIEGIEAAPDDDEQPDEGPDDEADEPDADDIDEGPELAGQQDCGTLAGEIGRLGDAELTSDGFNVYLTGAETCEIAFEVVEAFLVDLSEHLLSPEPTFPYEPEILGWQCTSGPFLNPEDPDAFFGCRTHNAEIELGPPVQ